MDPELKLHINETGKFRSEYLTCAIQNLGKLDSYKDFIFNNINKSISARVQKLQNLKSRINRIRAILPKLSECNHAMTIKSKKYYPSNKHNYYQYIHLEDRPEEINNLINTIYNVNNPNIPKTNIKKPLVDKGDKGNLGKIPRESFDDYISYQQLSNMQKTVKDLANELCELRFKNIGTSLVNELNDLVYEKTQYLETNFGFINKNLIQKAGLLWKVNKEESDFKSNLNAIQTKNDEEDEEPQFAKKSSKKLSLKLQEAPKSIVSKAKIEKYVNKKILLEKTREKTEYNLPTSINLVGVAELKDETAVEETPNIDENIYPEREDLDDFENQTDINNLYYDDDFDIVDIMMKRKNLDNAKNENANMTPVSNYNYQSANTSNINNVQSTMNLNVNPNVNNNSNSVPNAPIPSTVSSGNIVVVSGSGPGVPPPPPPPPPPPSVPVIKAPPKKPPKAKKEEEGEGDGDGEEKKEEKQEPVKEISMAEQLAMVKLKKVGTVKAKEVEEPKKPVNHNDLLKQQILLRFKNLRMHEKENENNDSDSEEEDDD